jgi:uncharacterized protein YndB with AHSA1/START domain
MPADAISITDAGPMILARLRVPGRSRAEVLAEFTDPAAVARWWRGELTTELAAGGPYRVAFPAIGSCLTGRVISYDASRGLAFSWSWDDRPPDSTVTVTVIAAEAAPDPTGATDAPDATGTVGAAGVVLLTIEHGPHSADPDGQQAHTEHWEGWQYFLPRLFRDLTGTAG